MFETPHYTSPNPSLKVNPLGPHLLVPFPVTPPSPLLPLTPSPLLSESSSSLDPRPQHLLIPQVYLWLEQLQMQKEYRGSTSTSWLKNHSEETIS